MSVYRHLCVSMCKGVYVCACKYDNVYCHWNYYWHMRVEWSGVAQAACQSASLPSQLHCRYSRHHNGC